MPINITMPALSPTMEEGNLAKWLVKEGDKVKSGDVIAEIETDKATMEVEAVDEGTVAKIVVPAGSEGVKVNALIAILAADGEDVAAAAAGGSAAPAPAAAAPAPKAEAAPAASPAPAAAPAAPAAQTASHGGDRVFSSPLARRVAKEAGIDISKVSGSGPKGRVVKSDVEKAVAVVPPRLHLLPLRLLPLHRHRSSPRSVGRGRAQAVRAGFLRTRAA